MSENIVDSGSIQANPTKDRTGPKPKELVEGTYMGKPVGRDKKVIDPNEVIKLAGLGMKDSEIAEWFGIDSNTLRYNFSAELLKGKHTLNCSLRQAQIRLALSGNATMLIWLGRNMLGQSENPLNSDVNAVLPWIDE
jgi:hypothetical protein